MSEVNRDGGHIDSFANSNSELIEMRVIHEQVGVRHLAPGHLQGDTVRFPLAFINDELVAVMWLLVLLLES